MIEVSKKDWKLFREKLADWQENYMERLCKEYIKLLSSEGTASDRFWELEKRIKQDRKHPGVMMELKKSDTYWDIASLLQLGVITENDLDGFSDDLHEAVKMILRR